MKQMMAELNANIAAIVLHSTGSTQEVFFVLLDVYSKALPLLMRHSTCHQISVRNEVPARHFCPALRFQKK